ncbi:serine/threonine-protein kinase [Urbifossiella limnaea]|uniref:non-specific serine/threonine protein kinase n=1 Tax=Urbifossiella limnaea TaxID=2528023 RepID=A0A517XLK6_9BACT|nr:serine/threonine-protein kinase [Urbifossiella limnaea]QDU18392.1 Serine/threonine-protein kinase PknB [Urbifossiella limnaea]
METQPSGQPHPPQDATATFLSPPQAADEVGRLGPYRVLKELGRGGMGAVFLAEDTTLKRRVALKVMLPHVAGDAARARFLREARAVAALKHDHVVTVYQAGEENGVPFLTMELLAGKTLDEWLRPDRRATPAQVLTIGRQIAEGLAAAHAAGLVHRDIKPANIWLEAPKGRVKLLDFGLARGAGGGDPGLTGTGDILGTPAYMAPEQARGQPLDHRCDLFSLGCVLYRMATGRVPFQGDSAYAVIVAVASEEPVPPRAVNPDVPPALEALIESLLAKDPAGRPASAAAALAEMRRVAARLDTTEKLPSGDAETVAWRDESRGSRRFVIAGVAAVALVAVVLVLVFGRGRDPVKEPDAAPPAKAGAPAPDPSAAGEPPAPEVLKVVGTWDHTRTGGVKALLVFTDDGKVTGSEGFRGKWWQSGKSFGFAGAHPGKGAPTLKVKGDLDADGSTFRLVSPKGTIETWQRRP